MRKINVRVGVLALFGLALWCSLGSCRSNGNAKDIECQEISDSDNQINDSIPPGAVEYSCSRTFVQKDDDTCRLKFRTYLPEDAPVWAKQFLAIMLSLDQNPDADIESKEKPNFGICNENYSISGINAYDKSPKEIAEYFFNLHEQSYRKLFEERGYVPGYEYELDFIPTWTSNDGKYVTYRFYSFYQECGSIAYDLLEYYLTFDAATGEVQGIKDFIKTDGNNAVMAMLEKEVTDYLNEEENHGCLKPFTDAEYEAHIYPDILREEINGVYCPRPALTNRGMVFSYQPNDIARSCAESVHILIPYSKLLPYMTDKTKGWDR